MIYKIDGKRVDIDICSDVFHAGYFDGVNFSDLHKEPDLGVVHDEKGSNPHKPGTHDYVTYKAGFIQAVS